MRKLEQRLWDRMRKALGDQFYLERIENAVGAGRPDVDCMYCGITLPLELKAAEYPARPTTAVLGAGGLNVNQRNWWLTWRQNLGGGFIVIGVERDLYMVPCTLHDAVNDFTREQLSPYQVDWEQAHHVIRREAEMICKQQR